MSKLEAIQKCREILNSNTADPAEEMITTGKVLMEIGKVLKGRSICESRAIMQSVALMSDVTHPE